MFDEILGLPAHPLIIHAAVMLTPLLAVTGIGYALAPRFRPHLAWAVVLLAVAAPASVFAARESGLRMKQARQVGGELVETHQGFSTPLLWTTIGLAAAGLALVYSAKKYGKVPTAVLSAVTVVLAGAAGYYVFRAGHSGATMVWGG
ncbi:DUF2231 domain-containing protein [Nonomuraea sp. NPDC046570]|uniref:DUF2231 domain-containing protein n=1 Tax=Nonomuraea sp. NPDC046570 TaxID=3155255 RepID=UPI0033F5C742